jgi:hypothetical protein
MRPVWVRWTITASAVAIVAACSGSAPAASRSPVTTEHGPPMPSTAEPAISPVEGPSFAALQRPLHLPTVKGGTCPASSGRDYTNSLFGGIRLGRGPVLPLVAVTKPSDAAPARRGFLRFRKYAEHPGWFFLKTLWFSFPRYQGPALIRGRQLDGTGPVGIGEVPTTTDSLFHAGPTVNGGGGFREWPGGTWIRAPGCYAWQVDGMGFSYTIVFRARLIQ